MSAPFYTLAIHTEEDVVAARVRAREIAASVGFDKNDQTRISTAVSEIARNAFRYADGGRVEFTIDRETNVFQTVICDSGPGLSVSDGGSGVGLVGAQRLMDSFTVVSPPEGGTRVMMAKRLPPRTAGPSPELLARLAIEDARSGSGHLLDELRHENQELLRLMEELRSRQDDLRRLNAELEDTNRGVVALYAELDEKAEGLRRADQMKSRFLSHMSHEFRTPLTSILALTRLLAAENDGKLEPEQHKQLGFIRKSAENLLEMVNDLLDLARIEAGRAVVHVAEFDVAGMFGALRGVLRPLQVNEAVELIFEDPSGIPPLLTDEAKVSQILRNFISNALKFTERGEVRVSARLTANGSAALFAVADTGIGIPEEQFTRIFAEFSQIETPVQRNFRGSGLGLALCKKFSELLGGRVSVESAPGQGSTFTAEIPLVYAGTDIEGGVPVPVHDVLLIDDEEVSRYLIQQCLGQSLRYSEAGNGRDAVALAAKLRPRAIILDLKFPNESGFDILKALKADPATCRIPVLIMTSKILTPAENASLMKDAVAVFSKEVLSHPDGCERIRAVIASIGAEVPNGEALLRR